MHLTDAILEDWALDMWTEVFECCSMGRGGWSPTRSAAVHWNEGSDPCLYYKCGDEGRYDLCLAEGAPKNLFDMVHLHEAVCTFCTSVKQKVLNCTAAPVHLYKQYLFTLQALIDEEWGRFDRLLLGQARGHSQNQGEGTVNGERAEEDDHVNDEFLGSCMFRVHLMEEEILEAVARKKPAAQMG